MPRIIFLFLLAFLCTYPTYSQEKETFRVLFWNVENLFDTQRDSLKQDEEFTPTSTRGWNYSRYKKKMADVARVITAAGEWEPPALVGLCEVENDNVLRFLTRYSPLKSHGYEYVMTESADVRGIDIALLYQKEKFKLLSYTSIRPDLGPGERPTRDILHVTGQVPTGDTLDIMVAHLPSRFGGERESEYKRLLVAQVLRNAFDSLVLVRREARVLIMGDFNDYPENRSIKETLGVKLPDTQSPDEASLYHLLAGRTRIEKKSHKRGSKEERNTYGSYKYQGEWGVLDHLIVSGSLLHPEARFSTTEDRARVVRLPFLLVEDEAFGGEQPFRTYNGMRYLGGYSDHLPVGVDFELILH